MLLRGTRTTTMIAAVLIAALTSEGSPINYLTNHVVAQPMTLDQPRPQVMDAANVVSVLRLTVASANFTRTSCNDQGDPPFHGEMSIIYPSDPSRANAEAEHVAQRLLGTGWAADGGFKSHATALTKGNVIAVFYPANASVARGHIDRTGECRDVTTTKAQAGIMDDLSLR